jgi:broad specificity phosphatase PhoE
VIGFPEWRVALALDPVQLKTRNLNERYWYRYPGGESIPDVRLRMRIWRDNVRSRFAGKVVLAVTHHIAILADVANHFGWNAGKFLEMDTEDRRPANTSVTVYRRAADEEHDNLSLDMKNDYGKILYD